jgi:hypothetical protein
LVSTLAKRGQGPANNEMTMKRETTGPLPSWSDGKAKQSIKTFAQRVATAGGKDFVPVAERIAVFDNDGCLSVAREIVPTVRASTVAWTAESVGLGDGALVLCRRPCFRERE